MLRTTILQQEYSVSTGKLAVLIDGDNVSPKCIDELFNHVLELGEVIIKRVYGDFFGKCSCWKTSIMKHSLKAVQQFPYTIGKNATDINMVIDAMDLIHTSNLDGFILVTNDSDFTPLALRIKEQGLKVYGVGYSHTSQAFQEACNEFKVLENSSTLDIKTEVQDLVADAAIQPPLSPQACLDAESGVSMVKPKQLALGDVGCGDKEAPSRPKMIPITKIKKLSRLFGESTITLSQLSQEWRKIQADFTPQKYGYEKLLDLVQSNTHLFFVPSKHNGQHQGNNKVLLVKIKKI